MESKFYKILNNKGSAYTLDILIIAVIATTLVMALLNPTYSVIDSSHKQVIEEVTELKGGGM